MKSFLQLNYSYHANVHNVQLHLHNEFHMHKLNKEYQQLFPISLDHMEIAVFLRWNDIFQTTV